MIELLFKFGNEVILINVNGKNVIFGNTTSGSQLSTIEGLKLSKSGVIKEFPDLKDNPDWHIEAIKRFKEKIKSFNTEMEIAKYLIDDLSKFGYVPWKIKQKGFRSEVIK